MTDVAGRLSHRVQLTTDGHKPYLSAAEDAFGGDVDFATLQKLYGADDDEKRYSPANCIGIECKIVQGDPDPAHISTSYVERHKPDDADAHASVHPPDERLQQEGGEPRARANPCTSCTTIS